MTPEEADHAEALRRIQEAEQTRAAQLDLRELRFLPRLPPELECLSSLQTLNLSGCDQLSDLSPLAALSSLQTLNLAWCKQLSDLWGPGSNGTAKAVKK
jgi:hypothetical protein